MVGIGNVNSATANNNDGVGVGGGSRRRRQRRGGNRSRSLSSRGSQARTSSRSTQNDENDDHHRDEFIASFQLNILSTSAPVLVRNDIRKLGNNCYSARIIKEYFENSNPHKINIRIVQIWKVHNVRHFAQFMQNSYDQVDNMLLWHGTSRANLISILQNSLKLPVQAVHGHMFGPGIYFADRMSKSANYIDKSGPAVFLLCQVALGKKYRAYQAENFQCAPGVYDTVKAVGKNVPDLSGEKMLGEYCKVPCGKTVTHRDIAVRPSFPLEYNEYIVYDQDRIRIKFIVHCERNSTGSFVTQTIPRRVLTVAPSSSNTNTIQNNTRTITPRPVASNWNATQNNAGPSSTPMPRALTSSSIYSSVSSSNQSNNLSSLPKPLASTGTPTASSNQNYIQPSYLRPLSNVTSSNSSTMNNNLSNTGSGSSSRPLVSSSQYQNPTSPDSSDCSCCVIL